MPGRCREDASIVSVGTDVVCSSPDSGDARLTGRLGGAGGAPMSVSYAWRAGECRM